MTPVLTFAFGLMFGLGLVVSGMSNPAKIIGFLNLAGPWDPSLMLVMAGALVVSIGAFRLAGGRARTLLGEPMQLPTMRNLDPRLMVGSALFGIGWGLAGICPGPALVLVGSGNAKGIVFALAMLAGMALFEVQQRLQQAVSSSTDA